MKKLLKIPDFSIGDRIKHLVSGETAEVVEVTDESFGLKFRYGGIITRYAKSIIKCQYKLVKSK